MIRLDMARAGGFLDVVQWPSCVASLVQLQVVPLQPGSSLDKHSMSPYIDKPSLQRRALSLLGAN